METMYLELIITGIGLLGAIIGYSFREYKNRVNPILEVLSIDTSVKRNDRFELDTSIAEKTKDTFYIKELQKVESLGNVYDTWDRCDDLISFWPEVKKALMQAIDSEDEESLKYAISTLLGMSYFEKWLLILLVNNCIDFKISSEVMELPEKIGCWNEKDGDYKIWFDLPPSAKSFGIGLKHPAIRDKCDPFIIAICRLYHDGISNAFKEFIKILEKDYTKALQCASELKKVDNQNSRWLIYCYIANTNNKPIIVERKGLINVIDSKTKVKYKENCYLAKIGKEGNVIDTNTPLVLGSGEAEKFCLITNYKQKEMDLGEELRVLYDKGHGSCFVSINICKSGLFRRQLYKSPKSTFVSSKNIGDN